MSRKCIFLGIILITVFSLLACSGPNSGKSTPTTPKPTETPKSAIEMVYIPDGTFEMGSPHRYNVRQQYILSDEELPVHSVMLSSFQMSTYEVTYALWVEVKNWAEDHGYAFHRRGDMGSQSNGGTQDEKHPVTDIEWYDAVLWCNALSEMEGRPPVYYTSAAKSTVYRNGRLDIRNDWVDWEADGYRLPTEAEWEYAARAGTATDYNVGNSITGNDANYRNSGDSFEPGTTPVGNYAPNAWGLYDMHGNVWEWVWDYYRSSYYSDSPDSNPKGPSVGTGNRVLRGGGWGDEAIDIRSTIRRSEDPQYFTFFYLGFRLVQSKPAATMTPPSSPTPSDDRDNGPVQAASVVQNEEAYGLLSNQNDADWFVWLADEPGTYEVSFAVFTGDGNVVFTVYSREEDPPYELFEVKRINHSDWIIIVERPTVYFFEVRKVAGSTSNEYGFQLYLSEDPSFPPTIGFMPANGMVGNTINIYGSNFGAERGAVHFEGHGDAPLITWSPGHIIAEVPMGSGEVEVVVETMSGKSSEPFPFSYGPDMDTDITHRIAELAQARLPEAEKRLREADESMWEAYLRANQAYRDLKETKGTEVFQDIDEAIKEVAIEGLSEATDLLTEALREAALRRGETGSGLIAPTVARYALAGLTYFKIGKWAAMDAVLIDRNIKSQWYTWAVLKPAIQEYERAYEELEMLRAIK